MAHPGRTTDERDVDERARDERGIDWRREVDRLRHEYNSANLGRSVRDCVWYAGQVGVMALSYKYHHLGIYPVLGVMALFVCGATGLESFKWRRELRTDKAEGRA